MIAAEQKARISYDNILRLADSAEVRDPIRFLREREIVHFQRFGEAKHPNLNRNILAHPQVRASSQAHASFVLAYSAEGLSLKLR